MKLYFLCNECGKRQRLEAGDAFIAMDDKKDPTILFERESMCKGCGSHDVEPTKSERSLLIVRAAFSPGREGPSDIHLFNSAVSYKNKLVPFTKAGDLAKADVEKDPSNGELRVRYANILCKLNDYGEAIEQFHKAFELDDRLLAVPINLCLIYAHRRDYYGDKNAKELTQEWLSRLRGLYASKKYNKATLPDDARAIVREVEARCAKTLKEKKKLMKEKIGFKDLRNIGDFMDVGSAEIIEHEGGTELIARVDPSRLPFTPLSELLNKEAVPVAICESNLDTYIPILHSIEEVIVDYYSRNPNLKDADVLKSIKELRDQPFDRIYEPKTMLGREILLALKAQCLGGTFSKNEVRACISKVYRSVKNHKEKRYKTAYLDFISHVLPN